MNCRDAEELFDTDQKRRYQRLLARLAEYNEHGAGARGGYVDYHLEGLILGALNDLCNEVGYGTA